MHNKAIVQMTLHYSQYHHCVHCVNQAPGITTLGAHTVPGCLLFSAIYYPSVYSFLCSVYGAILHGIRHL